MADESILQVNEGTDLLVVSDYANDILVTTDTLVVPNDEVTFITVGVPGPRGEPGPEGAASTVPGPQGEPGSGGDKNYVHHQMIASEVWSITHNLNKYPSISVVDSADALVYGDVLYVDNNNVIVTFTSGFAGRAYLN